jgi:hypothetical protein
MRHIIKIAALALVPLVLGGHARAAENEGKVITLSCAGTLTPTYSANNRQAAGAFAEAVIRSVELIVQPRAARHFMRPSPQTPDRHLKPTAWV